MATARVLGVAGALAYSWWILVPLRSGLMRSPSELFSNLEVTGRPYAAAMQHADLLSGLLLLAAFLLAAKGRPRLPEHLGLLVFAAGGVGGAIFPEVCADTVNATCRDLELSLRLPASQYLHLAAGIVEFAGITAALLHAFWRTRHEHAWTAAAYRILLGVAIVAYPLQGAAYLVDSFGGVVEGVILAGYTAMVLTWLFEPPGRAVRAEPGPPRAG